MSGLLPDLLLFLKCARSYAGLSVVYKQHSGPRRSGHILKIKEGQVITLTKPFSKGIHQGDNGDYISVKNGVVYRERQRWYRAPEGYPVSLVPGEYEKNKIKSHKVTKGGEDIYIVVL